MAAWWQQQVVPAMMELLLLRVVLLLLLTPDCMKVWDRPLQMDLHLHKAAVVVAG